jgi:hypothetical protein
MQVEASFDFQYFCCCVQDLLTALALTEAIYKVVTHGHDAAAAHFARLLDDLQGSSKVPDTLLVPLRWSSDTKGQM